MVPKPVYFLGPRSSGLMYMLYVAAQSLVKYFHTSSAQASEQYDHHHDLEKRAESNSHVPKFIAFAVLIPALVLLSGLFAGLTLGYMSLDETQLNVLSLSGTPKQREYANKIIPIRKNGHLLLVTLLLANMITNESLPVISDPILGGGVQSVAVSTVLIVIFSEIIPQSLFTRHGLYLGAKCAGLTKVLIYVLGVFAWPVAKLLEYTLGSHHGIIYRRAELKELIAMHSSESPHGGDLRSDTVNIIGATLDLQEKVVKQAMTPITDVFMLSIDSRLDYDALKKICDTGHSRIPVYEEIDIPLSMYMGRKSHQIDKTQKVKKIIGILLVKQCLLLDPKDAVPLRTLRLNRVPFVPKNEPLLRILDRFQEGKSHMAIVSRFSVERAMSVKEAVKKSLTDRLKESVEITRDTNSESDNENGADTGSLGVQDPANTVHIGERVDDATSEKATERNGEESGNRRSSKPIHQVKSTGDVEMSIIDQKVRGRNKKTIQPYAREQSVPADAVLAKEDADEFLEGFDTAVMPLGIITLEDVLEELIGEEIYDEFDMQGVHRDTYLPAITPLKGTLSSVSPKEGDGTRSLVPRLGRGTFSFLRIGNAPSTTDDGQVAGENRVGSTPNATENSPAFVSSPAGIDGKGKPNSGKAGPAVGDGKGVLYSSRNLASPGLKRGSSSPGVRPKDRKKGNIRSGPYNEQMKSSRYVDGAQAVGPQLRETEELQNGAAANLEVPGSRQCETE